MSVDRKQSLPGGPWWREWPLALAIFTLLLAWLSKAWITTALDQPVWMETFGEPEPTPLRHH
jgi:hypothetical protein